MSLYCQMQFYLLRSAGPRLRTAYQQMGHLLQDSDPGDASQELFQEHHGLEASKTKRISRHNLQTAYWGGH